MASHRLAASCFRELASIQTLRGFAAQAQPTGEQQRPIMPPFSYTPQPYTGPSKEEVIALRKQYLSPALYWHFREPVMITEGKMQYLFDEKGRRYLDVSITACSSD